MRYTTRAPQLPDDSPAPGVIPGTVHVALNRTRPREHHAAPRAADAAAGLAATAAVADRPRTSILRCDRPTRNSTTAR